jgi:hypothetical protein
MAPFSPELKIGRRLDAEDALCQSGTMVCDDRMQCDENDFDHDRVPGIKHRISVSPPRPL